MPCVLLLATDERLIARAVALLEEERFAVQVVADEARAPLAATRADIAVLDLAASRDGVLLCRRIRQVTTAPILIVSSGGSRDPVPLLSAGADDWLASSDRTRELVARVRALLRRRLPRPGGDTDRVRLADVMLDRETHRVTVRDHEVHLPLKQFQLLDLLLSNANRVVTRRTMVREVWGPTHPADSNTLEVQIKRLREVVEDDPRQPTRIKTVRGIGYTFVAP